MKIDIKRKLIIIALFVIALISLSSLLYVFWWSFLFGYERFGTYLFVADINQINEFWFEFIGLHLVLISVFVLYKKADLFDKKNLNEGKMSVKSRIA